MNAPSGKEAAALIRQVIAGQLDERSLSAKWPSSPDPRVDFQNSRDNLGALFSSRRERDDEMVRLLEEDLSDAADALDVGRPIEWFATEPGWFRPAVRWAVAIGFVISVVALQLGWPRWTWTVASIPLIVVVFANWMWARRL